MRRNHTDHHKKSLCCTRNKIILLRIISAAAVIAMMLTFMTGCADAGSKDNTSSIQLNAVNSGSTQITKAEAKAIDTYLYCTADDFVALRKSASASSTELARIPHGKSMTYLNKKSGKWYYVQYNGQKGYVYEDYVAFSSSSKSSSSSSVSSSSSSSSSDSTANILYCTASDYVSLRKSPSAKSTELAKIYRGEKMGNLKKSSGKWYYVQYGSKKGYVYSDYVSSKNPNSKSTTKSKSNSSSSSKSSSKSSGSSGGSTYHSGNNYSSSAPLKCYYCVNGKEECRCDHGYYHKTEVVPNFGLGGPTVKSYDYTCSRCKGTGYVTCTKCGGDGWR